MSRITMTRAAVLRFNERWDDSDRKQLEAFLDGNGEALAYKDKVEHRRSEIDVAVAGIPKRLAYLYRTASGGEVTGRDAMDSKLFVIRPGAIDLCMGVDSTILHFTTVGWWGPRQQHQEFTVMVTCPRPSPRAPNVRHM
jgi:hypothetical protein